MTQLSQESIKLSLVQFGSLPSAACPTDPSALVSSLCQHKTSPEALQDGTGHLVFVTSCYVDTMDKMFIARKFSLLVGNFKPKFQVIFLFFNILPPSRLLQFPASRVKKAFSDWMLKYLWSTWRNFPHSFHAIQIENTTEVKRFCWISWTVTMKA